MRQRLTTSILLIAGLLVFTVPLASADTSDQKQNITITPSSTNLTIAPGSSTKASFDAINNGSDDFSVTASVAPYHVENVTYDPQFTALPGLADTASWVRLNGPATKILKSHTLTSYDYSVSVPAGTAPGGYYAVLFATTSPTNAGDGVVAHNRVGNILYITVSGTVRSGGYVEARHVPSFIIGTGAKLGLLVANTGGVHYYTTSSISVTDTFGKTVYRFTSRRIVLPGTKRQIVTDWSTKTPVGLYHVHRSSTTPSGNKVIESSTVLVVQPWVIVATLLVLIVTGVLVVKIYKSKRRR